MLAFYKVADVSASLLHILSGLYSTYKHIWVNDLSGAIGAALITALCLVIITVAVVITEVVKAKARRYARKHELPGRKDRNA